MRGVLLILVLLAAGCTRPLATNEAAFAGTLFGPSLDVSKVRVAYDLGFVPPPPPARSAKLVWKEGKPGACDRSAPSPVTGPPAAFVSFNRMHYSQSFYSGDAMIGWPVGVRMPHGLLLAHELTHVWQWQNRRITGYHPGRALWESITNPDPYFYAVDPDRAFLDYGYEQQASLVEDYVCYRIFDPSHPKFSQLRAILAPVFPLDALDAALAR